jgi:uncharacterized protein (DUF58 family)
MLTTRGKITTIVGIVLLAIGIVFRYSEFVAVGMGALGAVAIGWFWVRGPQLLSITRFLEANDVEAGTDVGAVISVTNKATKAFAGGVLIDNLRRVLPNGDEGRPTPVPIRIGSIAAGGQITKPLSIPTSVRGSYRLGPLLCVRSDVFDLWRKDSTIEASESLVVRPRVHELAGEAFGKRDTAPARKVDASLNSSIAFDRLREYVVGDDLRRVHWRTSARVGELMVRETLDEIIDDIVIVLDDCVSIESTTADSSSSASQQSGSPGAMGDEFVPNYEQMVEIAASIAKYASVIGQRCRIHTTSGLHGEQGARAMSVEVMELLANTQPSARGVEFATGELRAQRPGGRLFLLTTRGKGSTDELAVLSAARSICMRAPRAYVIEVGGHNAGPDRQRSFTVWGSTTARSFAARWAEIESS